MIDAEAGLGLVGIPQIRQSQRGRIGRMRVPLPNFWKGKPLSRPCGNLRQAYKQVGDQPAEAIYVTDEPHVTIGDETLALATNTPARPATHSRSCPASRSCSAHQRSPASNCHIYGATPRDRGLHASQIRAAVLGPSNGLFPTDEAGHRHGPQPLLAQM